MTIVTGGSIVLPDRVIDTGSVVVEDGLIVDIVEHRVRGADVVDAESGLIIAGLVDAHIDALERQIRPRTSVEFPADHALLAFEDRLHAAGITTAFHGVKFDDEPHRNRTLDIATHVCAQIQARQADPARRCEHHILYRVETRCDGAVESLQAVLERDGADRAPVLVSYEDHAPGGRGVYGSLDLYRQHRAAELGTGPELDRFLDDKIAGTRDSEPLRLRQQAALAQLVRNGTARLLAHDPRDPAHVDDAAELGASTAEFPLGLDAAKHARHHGMSVIAGAPNSLRGHSHNGSVAANDIISAGLCTALVSDYEPSVLLPAALRIAEAGWLSLPQALGLVTSGPAAVAGLTDRGRIAPGTRADLAIVNTTGAWPRVTTVLHGGRVTQWARR
ncbi:alpha-D-ribose 1-methylphosphonate 5-triphosphate diphosphatase [Nocardia sp. NPDC004711]